MSEKISSIDLNDLIFQYKNKEYGAFVLRNKYPRFVSYATLIAVIFFTLALLSPTIVSVLTPKKAEEKTLKRAVTLADLGEPESIDKKETVKPKVEELKQLKSTIQFLPPVIKPDEKVLDDYIPTQEELKAVDPGKSTIQGDPTGVDLSLVEAEETKEKVVEENDARAEVFTYVEEMPSYPGGNDALLSYVAQNIVYPEIAKRASVEGKVQVSFVVGKDGRISNAEILKGIGAGCDEEAIRVIKSMPHWNPGKQNGRPVMVKVSIPIIFKLQ
ncbi:MAG: TonB family protein [Ignavibacteria bacterium]|nr:TonB family protein [Ignavibacteria bacterium]